jgi:hypothetical protein
MQEFITLTSFKGDYTVANDGRIFSQLNGKFNLPVAIDSIALCKNTDLIASQLEAIYKQNGANYTLKRTSYRHASHSCQYIQYWKNYYLMHQPYYLLITYNKDSNSYSVFNNLYTCKISIPDKVISVNTAVTLYDFVLDSSNMNPDLNSVILDFVSTDTTKVEYTYIDRRYELNFDVYLNLYPLDPNNVSSGFKLQWKRPDGWNNGDKFYKNLLIDAATGTLLADLKEIWDLKIPLVLAANKFIKASGIAGKAFTSFSSDNRYYGFEFTCEIPKGTSIIDTTSLRNLAKSYLPDLTNMYKSLGIDFKVDYQKTKRSSYIDNNYFYESNFFQSFRYPINMFGYGEYIPYGLRVSYDENTQVLKISARCLNKTIDYPEKVISYNSAFEISQLQNSGLSPEMIAITTNNLISDKVELKKIPKNNLYWKDNYTVRLCMQPIYSDQYGINDFRLIWFIFNTQKRDEQSFNYEHWYICPLTGGDPFEELRSSSEDMEDYYMEGIPNPVDAKIVEQEFASLGRITQYYIGSKSDKIKSFTASINLPVPTDSLSFYQNAKIISKHILNLHNANFPEIELIPQSSEGYIEPQVTYSLYYKGFPLQQEEGYPYWNPTIVISYNNYDNTYWISSTLPDDVSKTLINSIPYCIVTPETALYMVSSSKPSVYNWDELTCFKSNHNYWLDFEEPYESIYETRDLDYGSLYLCLYPVQNYDKKNRDFTYKLVWIFWEEGHSITIDAETGKILKEEWWDTC